MSGAHIANNPQIAQATRTIRRLYVGNLPSHLPLNELALTDYFVQMMRHLRFTTPEPVLSVSLHQERTYCFVEFRSVADTDAVLQIMNGAEMGDRRIRISRPKDYAPGPPEVQDFIVGYPPGSYKPPRVGLDTPTADPSARLAAIPTVPADTIESVLPTLIPALGLGSRTLIDHATSASPVVIITNIVDEDELVDEEVWLDVVDDVREECAKFGSVERVILPRPVAPLGVSDEIDESTGEKLDTHDLGPWSDPDDLGKVFVIMASSDEAAKVIEALDNHVYHKKKILVQYCEREYLDKYLVQ
jgi:splicing factor U2AF subunit